MRMTAALLLAAAAAQAQPITREAAQPGPHDGVPPVTLPGLVYDKPFFPGAKYDADVPTPDSILGYPVGSKPAMHAEIEAVIKAIAAKSPRVRLFEYARSHEGKPLYYAVIATPERIKDLEKLKADYAKLADPRSAPAAEVDRLAESTPALAWMAYVIHGDEMTGSDAALAVLHHLASSQDDDVKALLNEIVVVIDPLMNPDGRDRWIQGVRINRTKQPQVDDQSMLHTGAWPSGRMNHYLFDMNRDWIFGTQPETRGRIASVRDWHPHYFMESHEMGSQDTFLFMPAREAVNPNHSATSQKWVAAFGREQAAAFDQMGWRYYTGEWNDDWYPGYSSSWAGLRGAVQNLYEQASLTSDAVRRPEGALEAYREGVHKQVVSSMANLRTLSKNRKAVIADFVADRRRVLADDSPYAQRSFAIVPTGNPARLAKFLDLMTLQGFEVQRAESEFTAAAVDRLGRVDQSRGFKAGTLIISNRQPLARLIAAMLEFDPRMKDSYLTDERRELLRFGRSKIYDTTGWSLPMLHDVEAYELRAAPPAEARVKPLAKTEAARPVLADSSVGFAFDGGDDRSVAAAARLMEQGVWVRVSNKPTTLADVSLARGSVFVLKKDNAHTGVDVLKAVTDVAAQTAATVTRVATGWGEGDLPDLGGEHFVLLQPPRVAVMGREPSNPYSFGSAWYAIDYVLGLRASYVSFHHASFADLRRYNVIYLPEGSTPKLADWIPDLKAWVEAGGTLIASGDAAAAIATEKGLGSVRTLDEALTKQEPFIQAVIREYHGRTDAVASPVGYEFGPTAVQYPWDGAADEKPSDDELKRRDEWRKIFMPAGVVLAARTDDRSWLTSGVNDSEGYVPVLYGGGEVLLAPAGAAAARFGVFSAATKAEPATLAEAKPEEKVEMPKPGWLIAPPGQELRLRMSGLLWPEAAERLANTAYLTRESVGAGQVILFAADPNFRAATLGTSRLFLNAITYGPGMGASQPMTPRARHDHE